jgi:hypothetical protein
MNLYPHSTTLRSFIIYEFSILQTRARRSQFLAQITGSESTLAVFPEDKARLIPSRELIGIQNIRVDQIVGPFNRDSDFDRQFRPLKKHSLERWVNVYLLHEQDGWAPIHVHKVDGYYFVENGHHRVSVAHTIGMEFIEARVWEHGIQSKNIDQCQLVTCAKQGSVKNYAAG